MNNPLHPTGTVTFLFTDIQGSTQLWEHESQIMQRAFARQEALLREAFERNHGYAYKMIGDAFQVAFATAPDALAAALDAQRLLYAEAWEKVPIRVRMALHTGTTEERPSDYVGPLLNRVARLMSAGSGGQVLLSQATYDLVCDQLPSGVSLKDLGEHRLKDLVRPEHVYQLVAPDLPEYFPPLKTLDTIPHNLPLRLSSFIGRTNEISLVKAWLKNSRLVTLTGPGGSGKTRLSLQVATDLLGEHPNGIWLIELASLGNGDLIPQAIASTFGLHEEKDRPALTVLMDYLRSKELLLILDNCEHLIDACARLADELLRACPGVHILATSREMLSIEGEAVYNVPSLPFPGSGQTFKAEDIISYESVQLFTERVRQALPGFTVTDENVPAISTICSRLDGIPLTIELAAARAVVLTVEQIASRLDDRFRLLTSGSRTALPRHQTIQALIDWSYSLLAPAERTLFLRLSVFSGGWTLEAAEQVTGDASGVVDESSSLNLDTSFVTIDLLTQLVNKSLVIADLHPGEAGRYRMLETIRQYAQAKLVESGEAEGIRDRHLAYFLRFAQEIAPKLRGSESIERMKQLRVEHNNLRLALGWALDGLTNERVATGIRLANSLEDYWWRNGLFVEGRNWIMKGLVKIKSNHPDANLLRAKGLVIAGDLVGVLGDRKTARQMLEEAIVLYRPENDPLGLAVAIRYLGYTYLNTDYAQAYLLEQESISLCRQVGDRWNLANALEAMGDIAIAKGDYLVAFNFLNESLALFREIGDRYGVYFPMASLGNIAMLQGDYMSMRNSFEECLVFARESGEVNINRHAHDLLGRASYYQEDFTEMEAQFQEVLRISRDLGTKYSIIRSLCCLGIANKHLGRATRALTYYMESLPLAQAVEDTYGVYSTMAGMAGVAMLLGQPARCTSLLGAVHSLIKTFTKSLDHVEQAEFDSDLALAREALSPKEFSRAWKEGRQMTLDQAIQEAYTISRY